jgi:CRISPR system Cascade subunit CasC
MHDLGIVTAVRTKHVKEMIQEGCAKLGASKEKSDECTQAIADSLTEDTLHFFTPSEAKALATYAESIGYESKKVDIKTVAKIHKDAFTPALDGLDIALFGRMVAKAPDLNVEAAASFSHAISTHKVTNEVEFFTALDDLPHEPGSSHMGSLEFNSATYYRYVCLDMGQLIQTLGDDNYFDEAIAAFMKALYLAIPSARQATQSGASAWDFARVFVRKGQRLQVPFETAVRAKDGGFLRPSIAELNEYLEKKEKISGSLFGKISSWEFGDDENLTIDALISAIQKAVKAGKA